MTRQLLPEQSSDYPFVDLTGKRHTASFLPILAVAVLLGFVLVGVALAQGDPHGSYSAATDACAACHRTHTSLGGSLIVSSPPGNAFCFTCHNGTGAPLPPIVSTHSNVDFASPTEPASFTLECTQCHEPHGSTNLYSIREDVRVTTSPLVTTGPVVFTALTGADSFDEGGGDADNTDDICVTCHINASNPGNPMTNHDGGANHSGGVNYEDQDCTSCHSHDLDGDFNTLDGFMPSGGCAGCHSFPQDNGDGNPAGGRRAVVGEFGAASHHVQGAVQDSDCAVCHDTTNHANGYVELIDVDTLAIYIEATPGAFRPASITAADSKTLASFCLSCHDGNGASGDTTPFSDNVVVLVVDSTAWSNSAHNTGESTNSGYGCMGDGSATGCHDTGHGSNLANLLAPASGVPGADNVNQEEGFCYTCHDGATVSVDIQVEFIAVSSNHDVNDGDQVANGSAVECTNCHNPHQNTANQPLSDPDNLTVLWSDCDTERDFCLRCHDGAPPAGVTFPGVAGPTGTGWDKSQYVGSSHDNALGGPECRACHERHGSASYYALLKDQYLKTDRNVGTYSSGDFALCWNCHSEGALNSTNNAFESFHQYHSFVDFEVECIGCHDVHNAYDAGERGLINFAWSDAYCTSTDGVFTVQGGYDLSTAFQLVGNTGTCYVDCHGGSHGAGNSYTSSTWYTANCTRCHNAPQGTRRQVVDSNGDGTGTGGDFTRQSHHLADPINYTVNVISADCRACHQFSTHQGGTVVLRDADCERSIEYTGAASLGPFCLSCHDANGAGGSAPFDDGVMPPVIDGAAWSGSSHSTSGFTCYDCHDNGHGSNKIRLLAPWNYTNDGDPDDPMMQEERFCYDCHDTDGPASTDVQAAFGMASHHVVATSEQTISATKEVDLECISCHNPHRVTSANKVSDPDDYNALVSNDNDFCLACHDGTPPAGVAFGAYPSTGFGWDKSTYISNTTHYLGDVALPNIQCQDCHEYHGSNANYNPSAPAQTDTNVYRDLLKGIYTRIAGDASYYPDNFTQCWTCHDSALVLSTNNAWGSEHGSHDDDGPCIWCHDVHAPVEAGEPGLVSFYYGVTYGDLLLQYRWGPNDISTDWITSYDRNGNPQCGITCHGTNHRSRNFTSNPLIDPPGSTP